MKINININGKRWKVKTYPGRMFFNGEEFKSLIVVADAEIRLASNYSADHMRLIGGAVTEILKDAMQPTAKGRMR